MRRLAPVAALAALTALLLAGCTMGGSSGSDSTTLEMPSGEIAPAPEALDGEAIEGAVGEDAAAQLADRSVITTGWVSITVEDPVGVAADAVELAERAGGRVDNRSETPGTDAQPPSASLTLRIPSDELDGFVDGLRELGSVNSVSINASDVTQQRQDLDARIDALTASVDRLRELLGTATSITDLIAIESELTTRQAELDSLTQQRDFLVDQVDFSTITVDLVTEDVAPDAAPDDFWSGLVAGWNALVGFASWLGVAVGVLLPWLAALLVVGAIVITVLIFATRTRRRRPDAEPFESTPTLPTSTATATATPTATPTPTATETGDSRPEA